MLLQQEQQVTERQGSSRHFCAVCDPCSLLLIQPVSKIISGVQLCVNKVAIYYTHRKLFKAGLYHYCFVSQKLPLVSSSTTYKSVMPAQKNNVFIIILRVCEYIGIRP